MCRETVFVGEFEEGLEPVDLGIAEGFDIDPVVGVRDYAADGAFGRAPFRGSSTPAKRSMTDMGADCVFSMRRFQSRGLTRF